MKASVAGTVLFTAILAATTSTSAQTGDLCATVKSLAQAAQSGFSGIAGQRIKQYRSKGKVFAEDYAAKIVVAGGDCTVNKDIEDGTRDYTCWWDYPDFNSSTIQAEKLAKDVEACFGVVATARNLKGRKLWTIPVVQGAKGIEIKVAGGEWKSRRGTKNSVMLSVDLED